MKHKDPFASLVDSLARVFAEFGIQRGVLHVSEATFRKLNEPLTSSGLMIHHTLGSEIGIKASLKERSSGTFLVRTTEGYKKHALPDD